MTIPAPTPKDSKAVPGPFQFGLRSLFIATACFGALFAVMSLIGAMWSAILIWFLILALLHVVANAWGSHRWRRHGQDESEIAGEISPPWQSRPPTAAPPTRLRESTKLGWTMLAATITGAVLAGGLGAGSLACLPSEKVGYVAILVGGVSSAIVGGFFGFLASSFLEVASQAWREAVDGRPAKQALEAGKEVST